MSDLYDELESQRLRQHSRLERILLLSLAVVMVYTALAYLLLPLFWTHYEHQKDLANLPMVTRTGQGIPGDPMNVGLVGDIGDVVCAMHAAGWYPADPITLKSSIEIVGSVLLDRPYRDAPVSHLYYLGRREEKYTVAVTHHISADLDAERALLAADLENAGMVDAEYQVTGIGPTLAGHNGGGDLYYTDGEIWVLRLVEACKKRDGPAVTIPSPPATEMKDQIWHAIADAMPK